MDRSVMHADQEERLPELRAELELMKGAPSATGEPSWLLHDPVLNRFLQIDFAAHEALRQWRHGCLIDDFVSSANATGSVDMDRAAVEALVQFLIANRMTVTGGPNAWRNFSKESTARKAKPLQSLAHNYLFFRVPVWRPQNFLTVTLPLAQVLMSGWTRAIIGLLGVIGLYLVTREWDAFGAGIMEVFTWEGILIMGLALVIVKAAHELGHAYTAVHYGCRVHTIGIAFVLMAPLLYTDVTDAWRLRDRRKRLAIDSAGIQVELAIAALAVFAWAFLPDGASRSAAFMLAVASLFGSLAINLNPFMRFDGYYLLAECLGVDNLQSRAFAFGRWRLREMLFGLGAPAPEPLPVRLAAALVIYAWLTWIYRLVLFVGIALLVYHYFFKVLGIALFVLEIFYFVGRPVMKELKVWAMMRKDIFKTNRTVLTVGCLGLMIGLCAVPWATRVEIPAVVESASMQPIFAAREARIIGVSARHGMLVSKGDPIVRLEKPQIAHEIRQAEIKLGLARLQHNRRGADQSDLQSSLVIESAISRLQTKLAGLLKEREDLVIRAPFAGRIVQMAPNLHPGRWIGTKTRIAVMEAGGGAVARGYVSEEDLNRIGVGGTARFVPEEASRRSLLVRLDRIAASGARKIDIPDLSSTYDGRIAVTADHGNGLQPTAGQYQVRMTVLEKTGWQDLTVRGVVVASGRAESILARMWRRTLQVLVRESGV